MLRIAHIRAKPTRSFQKRRRLIKEDPIELRTPRDASLTRCEPAPTLVRRDIGQYVRPSAGGVVRSDVADEGEVGDLLAEDGNAVQGWVIERKGRTGVGVQDREEGGGRVGGAEGGSEGLRKGSLDGWIKRRPAEEKQVEGDESAKGGKSKG